MILGGDIGGTKCNLALFQEDRAILRMVFQRRLATKNYGGFEDLVADFLEQALGAGTLTQAGRIEAAAFGHAGVVVEGSLHADNLPWVLNVPALQEKLNLKDVGVLNDLTATALSLERLSSNDLVSLNPGVPVRNASKAVIAAGTGLGEAILFW